MKGGFEPESAVDAVKQFYAYQEPKRINAADRTWEIRKRALDGSYGRKRGLTVQLLRLSPAVVYDNASAVLAGTDLGSVQNFVDQVQEYRKSFIQYLNGQGAFSSERWFRHYDEKDRDKLDLSGVPVFEQRAEDMASTLSRGSADMLLLIILNVIFFILSHTLFVKQEV
jgi:hypothetical protein